MRRALIATGLLLAAVGLVARPAAGQEAPRRGGVLQVAITAEPNTTDCHAGATFTVLQHLAPHYSTLLKFDGNAYPNVVGDLAESWTVADGGTRFTFRLRRDVRFHDGSLFTARDVAASFERLRHPPDGVVSPRKAMFGGITAIETPDDATVVFRLAEPDAAALTMFASPWNCIYSAAKLAADPRYPEKAVMGTGPFRFAERVAGSHWAGTRFDGYFVAGQPYLDGFRIMPMSTTAIVNSIQGGQIHAEFRGFTPPQADRLVKALGDRATVQESPFLVMLVLSFNTEKPPFGDVRVRRALTLAIDRELGSQNLSKVTILGKPPGLLRPGYAMATTTEERAALPGYGPDMATRRAEARRLLAEAGVPNLKFTLGSRSIGDPYPALGVFLIDQWRQIGVTVDQTLLETAAYVQQLANGTFDVIVDFSNEFVDEPTLQLAKYLSRDRSETNSARYTDREADALYDRQRRETDPAKRRELVRAFEARILDQAYFAPLFNYQRIMVHAADMRGWKITPSQLLNQDLAGVWLAGGR